MAHHICFIDGDDRFEIPLFRDAFVEFFDIIAHSTLVDCKAEIDRYTNWMPELFVLDLYYPCGDPDVQRIEDLKAHPLELPPDEGQMLKAFINRNKADERLKYILEAWKQETTGGIELARSVCKIYPNVPIVFYSRKATTSDALICMQLPNVVNVIQKPTGATEEESRALTLAETTRKRLVDTFTNSITMDQKTDVKEYIRRFIKSVEILSAIPKLLPDLSGE